MASGPRPTFLPIINFSPSLPTQATLPNTSKMKISLTIAAIAAVALASSAEAFRVCKWNGWQDDNTCAYQCKNGDPVDAEWCQNFKSALEDNGTDCWGDCNSGNGYQFWCSKASLSPSDCASHFWNN
ncbi:unnamed protein product [Mortierella alpina]